MFVASTPPPPPPAIEITYVGGPTTVIEIDGYRIITDPTFDQAKTVYPGGVTLVKTQSPRLKPEQVGKIDLVMLSHDTHSDNLDRSGREFLTQVRNTFTTVSGAERIKDHVVGLKPWETRTVETPKGTHLLITATPGRHGPAGLEPVIGDVIGFVITHVESKTDLLYVTGDTVWYDGVREVSQKFQPRAVLLFAGLAMSSRGPFRLTMDVNDAIEVANAFPKATIVPVHHEGWEHYKQSLSDLEAAFGAVGLKDRIVDFGSGRKTVFRQP